MRKLIYLLMTIGIIGVGTTFSLGWMTEVKSGQISPREYVARYTASLRGLAGALRQFLPGGPPDLSAPAAVSRHAGELAVELWLQMGGTVKGFVLSEDPDSVWMDIGIGKLEFKKVDILSRSTLTAEDTARLVAAWDKINPAGVTPGAPVSAAASVQIDKLLKMDEQQMLKQLEALIGKEQ